MDVLVLVSRGAGPRRVAVGLLLNLEPSIHVVGRVPFHVVQLDSARPHGS